MVAQFHTSQILITNSFFTNIQVQRYDKPCCARFLAQISCTHSRIMQDTCIVLGFFEIHHLYGEVEFSIYLKLWSQLCCCTSMMQHLYYFFLLKNLWYWHVENVWITIAGLKHTRLAVTLGNAQFLLSSSLLPLLRGNVVTQIQVMVNKWYFHYPLRVMSIWTCECQLSACIYFLLQFLQISHRNWTFYTKKLSTNSHKHFIVIHCLLMLHLSHYPFPLFPQINFWVTKWKNGVIEVLPC